MKDRDNNNAKDRLMSERKVNKNVAEVRDEQGLPVAPFPEDDDFSKLDERFGDRGKNKYYSKVSAGYRNVKLVLIVLLVAVVLFALLLGADNFTYANLRYLLRNFGEATVNDTDLAETIEFDIDADISVGVFGGKLAVAGEESFALYRMSGKKVYSEASEYRESIISCGEKYTVLWSYGERSIYVYNAVSLIHKETFERPVLRLTIKAAVPSLPVTSCMPVPFVCTLRIFALL